jgi:hypothetical protein
VWKARQVMTEYENLALQLKAIIDREAKDGCSMADDSLIESALRRWKSYDRRFPRHKDKSLEHRAHDLEKGFLALFPDHTYDQLCLRHLAKSFAEVLSQGTGTQSNESSHSADSQ